jgi:oligopeptide/dipeptide ABC transporter ATP-binding protein
MPRTGDPGTLLEIRDLRTHFATADGLVKAVDGVSFGIRNGATLGVVGESGCGKSVTALSVMRLIERPGRIVAGAITFGGQNLIDLPDDEMREIRGNSISMIFQEPMTSLNPVYTCGNQIAEAVSIHGGVSGSEARKRAIEMLGQVGIPDAARRAEEYPHQLSGGMRQRVMIAMALSTNPELLIADEPTTALDVTIQAQVIELMARLRAEFRTSLMFITHDLGVVANIADDVAVMYLGKIVEKASSDRLYEKPSHPYTKCLMSAIPKDHPSAPKQRIVPRGEVPSAMNPPPGCPFHPRCPWVFDRCPVEAPQLLPMADDPDHVVSCHLYH